METYYRPQAGNDDHPHYPLSEEAESLSDRIGVMNGGRLVALGSADDIVRQTGAASF